MAEVFGRAPSVKHNGTYRRTRGIVSSRSAPPIAKSCSGFVRRTQHRRGVPGSDTIPNVLWPNAG